MESLHNIIENPLLREVHARCRAALKSRFPDLASCVDERFLALSKYIRRMPERFYSQGVYDVFSTWLRERDKMDRGALQRYLSDHDAELDRAFLHIQEINSLGWHDYFEKPDDYELIRFIDRDVHPTYLRLVEGVLMPLTLPVAYFSRLDRGKSTEGLNLWSAVQEILRTTLSEAVAPYKHIIRNGIAHGGITYLQKEVRYRDNQANEEKYRDTEIMQLCDDLLDSCNALALALSLFLLTHQAEGYRLPRELLLDELREETRTPWWEIIGCTPSEFAGKMQLIIHARPKTSDYSKVQMSTFQSGLLAERFAPGFDRYFLSLRSISSWPGWAAFNGMRLRELRKKKDVCLADYTGTIEDNLIFYVPHNKLPRILARLHNMTLSCALHWPLVISDIQKNLGWPEIYVRNAKIHRNAWGCVLNGDAIIDVDATNSPAIQHIIRRSRRRIVHSILKQARRNTPSLFAARYLPLGFACVAVFSKDFRRRRLANFGLGEHLICTIQVKRIRRIRCPDIIGSTVEQIGLYRIAWNKAWLER